MKRGLVVGISAAAALVVAAGAATAWWVLSRPPRAADTALAFFTALDRGDADAALELTDTASGDRGIAERALAAAAARPADAEAGAATESDGSATVTVAFRLGDAAETATLRLRFAGGRWVIADPLATVTATTTLGAAVAIGDVVLPTTTDAGSVRLLPGRYVVTASPSAVLSGEAPLDALPGRDASVAVTASLSDDARAAAQAQLDEYARACAAPADAVPAHCGLRVPWAADLTSLDGIAFRVEQTPQVALAADGRSFAATGGVIVATATGTARAGGTTSFTYRADDWALRGTVAFDADAMVLAVR